MTGSGKTVTRVDLCEAVYQKVGLSRTESSAFVELVLKEITDCLEKGETVKLSSFGSFMVRKKGQRIGRNPKTGTEVPISPRRVMVFKPSAILRQRIMKEHGVASVQRLADATAIASFGAIEEVVGRSVLERDHDDAPGIDVDDDDYEGTDGIDFRLLESDEDGIPAALDAGPIPGVAAAARPLDVARLEGVLQELIACRQLLDSALKEG